jgi:hypothetical protein
MSLTHDPGTQDPGPEPVATSAPAGARRRTLWPVCFVLLAFELGAFLVIFPWTDSWTLNHLPNMFPSIRDEFRDVWDDPYFKSAVTGLGVLNLSIATRSVLSLFRNPASR